MPEPLRCRHIHTQGHQCGSPALRGERLCYHHHAARRPALRPNPLGQPTLPDPEDLHAVQRGLAELLRLVARELIADKQAKRLFAILAQAGTNLARIDRARDRRRHLALAEARFAARHPEAAAAAAIGCPADAPMTSSPTPSTTPNSASSPPAPTPNQPPKQQPDPVPKPGAPPSRRPHRR